MAEDLFLKVQEAIVRLDDESLTELTDEVIKSGIDPLEAIQKAYVAGIRKVGDLFENGDYFLPELVSAAGMVKASVSKIEKLIPKDKTVSKGKIVLGTVLGDIHDIGKSLVGTMLTANGFDVIDLGVDCPPEKFVDRALDEKADIIGASCLLTMTAPEQMKLIECLKERGVRDRFKVIVGGAAVTGDWADEIGADAYGVDLNEAVQIVESLIGGSRGGK